MAVALGGALGGRGFGRGGARVCGNGVIERGNGEQHGESTENGAEDEAGVGVVAAMEGKRVYE